MVAPVTIGAVQGPLEVTEVIQTVGPGIVVLELDQVCHTDRCMGDRHLPTAMTCNDSMFVCNRIGFRHCNRLLRKATGMA